MKKNRLKQLLGEGKYTCGTWVTLCSQLGAEVVGMAGFDWLLVDMEHGSGDYQTLMVQLLAIESSGDSTPIVRVQWNDPNIIKRVLDLGAYGVMVPGIRNAAEAKQAVSSIKYPPDGTRGIAGGIRASRFGRDGDYLKEANDNIMMFLQFETADSIENVAAILDTPGIDVAFIGPNDLSASLGHRGNPQHKEVQDAIRKVEDIANQKGIPLGSVSRNWEQAKALVDKGYRAVSIIGDIPLLIQATTEAVKNFREHPDVAGS